MPDVKWRPASPSGRAGRPKNRKFPDRIRSPGKAYPPWSEMVATDVVTFGEIGFDEKEIGLMILGNYYAIIVTIRQAKENRAIWGLCNVVWGV